MPERPRDGPEIRGFLLEVAGLLPDEPPQSIIIVGGALLALHELRATTVDVDSVRRLTAPMRQAVEAVAHHHGLTATWLNDFATAFRPRTLTDDMCMVLLDHPRLLVLGAPLRQVFLMKVHAARTRDYDDLVALWPHCSFDSPAQALAEYGHAFPEAPDDPFLGSWIAEVARRAGRE